jgi:glycerophosphoryl diester phosphodiesterase
MKHNVKLIAHGGYSSLYPENTLDSYQAALSFNPFAVEMDVVLHPATGELVCFHPSGVSSGSGTYTAQEVQHQLEQGDEFPRLCDVLAQLQGDVFFLLDLKQPSEATINALLHEEKIDQQRLILGLRTLEMIEYIRAQHQSIEVLGLLPLPSDAKKFSEIKGGKYFRIIEKDVTSESVKEVQALGLEAWITPGKKSGINQPRTAGEADVDKLLWLEGLGVDGILVNDIKQATEVLQQ